MSIQSEVYAMFSNGLNNKQVLFAVLKAHPEAKTSMKCIYWYRNAQRKANATQVATVQPTAAEQVAALRAQLAELEAEHGIELELEATMKAEYGV